MFSKTFIERPRFAVVISIVIALTGIICLFRLPVTDYPEIAPPSLYVYAVYDGASAEVIAENVATPIEDEINGVDNLLYFSSTCDNSGIYNCTVTFKSGTNTDMALVNLQNAVKRAEPKLPSSVVANGVSVEKRGSDMLAVFIFMTDGTNMNMKQLNNAVSSGIKDAVARTDGVSSVEVFASQEYSMRIWLDPMRMAGLRVSVADISDAVNAQNFQAAAGAVGRENSNDFISYKLNVQGQLKTAEEFEDIVLRSSSDGSIVRLKDVARVEIGSESYSGSTKFNGRDAVAMSIYRAPDANALSTIKKAKAVVEEWGTRLPAGVTCELAYDPSEYIKISIQEIVMTLITALALVVLITWLFLQDWRATLIPSIAIPVALLGTFLFMYILGYSVNTLTMFGLILVLGSLCDDAIVVVENCQTLMERDGLSPKVAAIKSMEQITRAIIVTTLVTVACYVPLAFYGGMVGAIYLQFAVTMCIALCLSSVVALTLSPAMCAVILKNKVTAPAFIFSGFNTMLNGSRTIYSYFVAFLVRRTLLTLLLFACVLGLIFILYAHTENSFLPEEDKGEIFCDIELPRCAALKRTEKVIAEFNQRLKTIKGIRSSITVTGMSMLFGNSENVAMAIISLENWDKRKTPETQIGAIISKINEQAREIADAKIIIFTPPAIMGLGLTGGVSFQLCGVGVSPRELSKETGKFAKELVSLPEVQYAMSSFHADTPQLYLQIDRQKTETLGVDVSSVFTMLQSKLSSLYINDFSFSGKNYKVKMQSDASWRENENNIMAMQVRNKTGQMVPLASLATLHYVVGPDRITRFNKMTAAEFNTQSNPGSSSSQLISLIENKKLPKSYHIEWMGQSLQEKENQGRILLIMALALFFAYLFLVAQYESWMIPVPVMLSVTFAILGALLGLFISGESMSIYAQLGMVMLIGLAAKNAILVVEFSKQEREKGKSVFESAMNGANLRYRAVLMTAWSFIFGVLPMVIASGAGAGSRRAIGITTFSGMLLATLIGILFTPAFYAGCQKIREYAKACF